MQAALVVESWVVTASALSLLLAAMPLWLLLWVYCLGALLNGMLCYARHVIFAVTTEWRNGKCRPSLLFSHIHDIFRNGLLTQASYILNLHKLD